MDELIDWLMVVFLGEWIVIGVAVMWGLGELWLMQRRAREVAERVLEEMKRRGQV